MYMCHVSPQARAFQESDKPQTDVLTLSRWSIESDEGWFFRLAQQKVVQSSGRFGLHEPSGPFMTTTMMMRRYLGESLPLLLHQRCSSTLRPTVTTTAFTKQRPTSSFFIVAVGCRRQLYHDPRVLLLAAQSKLGLTEAPTDPSQLRQAYLKAIKQCHPDLQHQHPDKSVLLQEFRQVQHSYELLLMSLFPSSASAMTNHSSSSSTSHRWLPEQNYRDACQDWLGLTAEKVEESLTCPMFHQWLGGKSDAAYQWRTFLDMYPHRLSYYRQQQQQQQHHHNNTKSRHHHQNSQTAGATHNVTPPLRRKRL